jgi:hypothetical protein
MTGERMFEVMKYEHPHIFVRSRRTAETYKLLIGNDGVVGHDGERCDLGDARRTAIAFLAQRARAATVLART